MSKVFQSLVPRIVAQVPTLGLEIALVTGIGAASRQERSMLLCDWLAHRLDLAPAQVDLRRSYAGAPLLSVSGRNRPVSLARSADFLLIAIADHAIGVDLEAFGSPRPPPWNLLGQGERAELAGLATDAARHEAFLRNWVVKEALVKARGTGFVRDPSSLDVSWRGVQPLVTDEDGSVSLRFARVEEIDHASERLIWACVVL